MMTACIVTLALPVASLTPSPAHASSNLSMRVGQPSFADGQKLLGAGRYVEAIDVWDGLLESTPESTDTREARTTLIGAVLNAAQNSIAAKAPARAVHRAIDVASRYVERVRDANANAPIDDRVTADALRRLGSSAVSEGKRRFGRKKASKGEKKRGIVLALWGHRADALAAALVGDDTRAIETLQRQYARVRHGGHQVLAGYATDLLALHLRLHAAGDASQLSLARDLLDDIGKYLPSERRPDRLRVLEARVRGDRPAAPNRVARTDSNASGDAGTDEDDDLQIETSAEDGGAPPSPMKYERVAKPMLAAGIGVSAGGVLGLGTYIAGWAIHRSALADCAAQGPNIDAETGLDICRGAPGRQRRAGRQLGLIGLSIGAPLLTAGVTMIVLGAIMRAKAKKLARVQVSGLDLGFDGRGRPHASLRLNF